MTIKRYPPKVPSLRPIRDLPLFMGGEGRRIEFFNLIIFAQRFARKVIEISVISHPKDGPLTHM